MIPRIIHQIWLGESGGDEPPPHFEENGRTWREQNPGWAYRRWSGADVDALFQEHRPDLLPLYRAYPYWVERADAARYLILSVFGGVYADHDIRCRRPLDEFADADAVLAPTEPFGISNDFMMARPGHPILEKALDELPASFARWHRPYIPRHFRIMYGTGSLHLTRALGSDPAAPGLRLLTAQEYGHGDPSEAYVRHMEGNSWAAWDTHLLLLLGNHWKALATLVVVTLLALVVWTIAP